jgi:hypothetical protein
MNSCSERIKKTIAKNKKSIECLVCHKIVSCKQVFPHHLKKCCGFSCGEYAKIFKTEEWVLCPICNTEYYRTLSEQRRDSNKTCSNECSRINKTVLYKKKCLEKYGVDNVMKVDSVKKTSEQTCLERYGSKHYFTSEEGRNTYISRSIELFGTEHPMQSEEGKNRLKKSNLENYGTENIFASDYFHSLMKEKHGESEKSQKSISKKEIEFKKYLLLFFDESDIETQYKYISSQNTNHIIDYYIKSENLFIMFDGDFWHGFLGLPKKECWQRKAIRKNTEKDCIINTDASIGKLKLIRITDSEYETALKENRDPIFYKTFLME